MLNNNRIISIEGTFWGDTLYNMRDDETIIQYFPYKQLKQMSFNACISTNVPVVIRHGMTINDLFVDFVTYFYVVF